MPSRGYLGFHPAPGRPRLEVMPLACDAHVQVLGPEARFPYFAGAAYVPSDAPKEALFLRHALFGFDRGVLVQPDCHGFDHRALLDALSVTGDAYRGVALLDLGADDTTLALMHRAGIRAVRVDAVSRRPLVGVDAAPLARIAPLGWHVEVDAGPEALGAVGTLLVETSGRVVLTRMGRLPVAEGTGGAAFRALADLLTSQPRLWVKLEGAEYLTGEGPPYRDVDPIARGLIAAAPDRVVWGTGWPHPDLRSHMPDDAILVDRLAALCPDSGALKRLLVDNPTRLYWPERAR